MERIEITAQYLAGFFDGEGSVVTYACERYYKNGEYKQFVAQLRIALSNTNLNVLHKIQFQWGGRIFGKLQPRKINWKKSYTLAWDNRRDIFRVLESIAPYLVVKKDQVDLILQKWPRGRLANKWHRTSDADRANCGDVNAAIRAMNKRGAEGMIH